MSARPSVPSGALLNARYVAIRTAEAKGLTDRLFQASRDRTPGVRRLLAPLIYQFWHNNREQGWALLQKIARSGVRFPGIPNRDALETFGEVSMPILNACRQDPEQLARLAAIWRMQMEQLFASPLARTGRFLARRWVLKAGANALAEVLKRQPAYQPVTYAELDITFARPEAFREMWRQALGCLEHPESGAGPIADILSRRELPFDLYLMLSCERTLIYHGVRVDPAGTIDLLERVFREGCPWFRGSIIYVLFNVLSNLPDIEDAWLDRYATLIEEFVASRSWDLTTAGGRYILLNQTANADVVAARHGKSLRVMPGLLERAILTGDQEQVDGLLAAVDGVATFHDDPALALSMIERAYTAGKSAIEERVLQSLSTVRLQNQPLVDSFLAQHRVFAKISPAQVAAVAPSLAEEDLVTLIDGFMIHMMLNSTYFRGQLCGAFRRALVADSVQAFLVQIFEWVRDELAVLPAIPPA